MSLTDAELKAFTDALGDFGTRVSEFLADGVAAVPLPRLPRPRVSVVSKIREQRRRCFGTGGRLRRLTRRTNVHTRTTPRSLLTARRRCTRVPSRTSLTTSKMYATIDAGSRTLASMQ
jgi:hypothetical protein